MKIDLSKEEIEMAIKAIADIVQYTNDEKKLIHGTNLLGKLGKVYSEWPADQARVI